MNAHLHEIGTRSIEQRMAALPWLAIHGELDGRGFACVPRLLGGAECRAMSALYDDAGRFRSRVVMSRHGFGRGEYQYFDHPLPELVERLRVAAYRELVGIANAWAERMHLDRRFPTSLEALHVECGAAGQARPTPLLLKYGVDDYNCLHQDLYGGVVFPLQMAVLLSDPGQDFEGGELVLTEQRPRMQSRVEVVPLERGDAVILASHQRPVEGTRGSYRVQMRHGVSRIRKGHRMAMGIIFHDAS